jgi:hypothetical protein
MGKRGGSEANSRTLDDILNVWPCEFFRLAKYGEYVVGPDCVGFCIARSEGYDPEYMGEDGEYEMSVMADSLCWNYNSRETDEIPPCGCGAIFNTP